MLLLFCYLWSPRAIASSPQIFLSHTTTFSYFLSCSLTHIGAVYFMTFVDSSKFITDKMVSILKHVLFLICILCRGGREVSKQELVEAYLTLISTKINVSSLVKRYSIFHVQTQCCKKIIYV